MSVQRGRGRAVGCGTGTATTAYWQGHSRGPSGTNDRTGVRAGALRSSMCLVPLRTLLKPRSGRRERRSNSSCSAISRSSQSITVASVSAAHRPHPPCRRVGRGTALLASSWNRSVHRTAPHHARPDYPVLPGTPEYPISHQANPASHCALAQHARIWCGALRRWPGIPIAAPSCEAAIH